MGISARRELRILGLQRSGNHGIINWIIKQSKGPLVFLNNLNPAWRSWMTPRFYVRDGSGQVVDMAFSEWLIYSLENKTINELINMRQGDLISVERRDMLILRDPYNTFASWMADAGLKEQLLGCPIWHVQRWCEYAEEFLSRQRLQNGLYVNFNQWASEQAYRQELAGDLRLAFTDAGADQVAVIGHGGGSSFGDRDVLNRWQRFIADSSFRALFTDDRMTDLAEELFSVPGAQEALS